MTMDNQSPLPEIHQAIKRCRHFTKGLELRDLSAPEKPTETASDLYLRHGRWFRPVDVLLNLFHTANYRFRLRSWTSLTDRLIDEYAIYLESIRQRLLAGEKKIWMNASLWWSSSFCTGGNDSKDRKDTYDLCLQATYDLAVHINRYVDANEIANDADAIEFMGWYLSIVDTVGIMYMLCGESKPNEAEQRFSSFYSDYLSTQKNCEFRSPIERSCIVEKLERDWKHKQTLRKLQEIKTVT